MRIEEVDTVPDNDKLQRFIHENKLLFCSDSWLGNYNENQIHRRAILNNNDEIIGCFCYYTFKKAIFRFVITPPFAPHIGLYYKNPSASVVGKHTFDKELLGVLAKYFAALKAEHADINLPYAITDTQPFTWKGFDSKMRYSYLLDLSLSEEKLWENLSSKKRQNITRAEKDRVEVSLATDFQPVFELIQHSLKRSKLNKNTEIIKKILFSFSKPENSFAFIAKVDGKPLSATYCVFDGDNVVYLFGGFDEADQHNGAGVTCMWQSILRAKSMGRRAFDFEGSMYPGIERYFREFGGTLTGYPAIGRTSLALATLMRLTGRKP